MCVCVHVARLCAASFLLVWASCGSDRMTCMSWRERFWQNASSNLSFFVDEITVLNFRWKSAVAFVVFLLCSVCSP